MIRYRRFWPCGCVDTLMGKNLSFYLVQIEFCSAHGSRTSRGA